MKNIVVGVLVSLLMVGCYKFPKYQAPYNIPKVTVDGKYINHGQMVDSTHKRYWFTYEKAINAEGYITILDKPKKAVKSQQENKELDNQTQKRNAIINGQTLTYENFRTESFELPSPLNNSIRKELNKQLFIEGTAYARAICTSYFQNAVFTKAHRSHVQKQTNIGGGLVSAALGLADVSSGVISGAGVAFSGINSSFDAYNESFLVSPNLGLIEKAVFKKFDEIYSDNKNVTFDHVGEVLIALSSYDQACSQSGMQALVDESLSKKIEDFREKKKKGKIK